MRIDAFSAISGVYNSKGTFKANNVNKPSFSDSLEISRTGHDFQVAKNAVNSAPDVREDKVADVKALMSAGNYYVSSQDLAQKLVGTI